MNMKEPEPTTDPMNALALCAAALGRINLRDLQALGRDKATALKDAHAAARNALHASRGA